MLRTRLKLHRDALLKSLKGLRHSPWITVVTMLTIASTLLLPTLFSVVIHNFSGWSANWQKQERISLYLHHSVTPAEVSSFLNTVQQTKGVAEAHVKSNAEALNELQQQMGMEDVMHYLPENPLPTAIEIIPTASISSPTALKNLVSVLKAYPQVEQAKMDLEWVDHFHAMVVFVNKVIYGAMILLSGVVLFIVGNTLHSIVQRQQEEIDILKLIGASNSYIARSFLYTGCWYGFGGAILTILLTYALLGAVNTMIHEQQLLEMIFMNMSLGISMSFVLIILLIGTLLGWLGAQLSVRKELSF